MINIIVYSKPNCVQCSATYKGLDKIDRSLEAAGLKQQNEDGTYGSVYSTINIAEDQDAYDYAIGLGHLQAPVVVVTKDGEEPEHWSGYRPDRIKALEQTLIAETAAMLS